MFKNHAIKISAITVLAALTYVLLPTGMPEAARRVAFIFVIAACFWAFEVIPLYATSLVIVFLEIILLCRPGGVLNMDRSGYEVFLLPFGSPVIILFLGGFVLALALHKYKIDRFIAVRLMNFFGRKPYSLLCGFMLTTALLSMWMSNTATAAMMVAMVAPLLEQMAPDDRFRKSLVLGIAFAASVGGMGTPIGTPPNAIALGILADYGIYLDFLSWMKMAVPLVIALLAIISFILIALFPPKEQSLELEVKERMQFDRNTKAVAAIAAVTVVLWLTSGFHKIPISVVALLPVCLYSATGLINQQDLRSLNWDILVLMWGGLALGQGIEISGLADWLVKQPFFAHKGFVLVAVLCFLGVGLSTFMSNTATANLLIPIVMAIPGESHILLAVTIALSCSLALALPISTPPNAIAYSTNAFHTNDMIKAGIISSLIGVSAILAGFKFIITKAFGL